MIVMEYLVGRPLTKLIADGPAPPAQVVTITRHVAEGMTAAHRAGIVHGDLKPANIMLLENGVAKILDFGLSRHFAASRDGESTIILDDARHGQAAGTPSYMSPETAGGSPPAAASDVFSLGLVIFELLTAKRAVAGGTVLQSLEEIRTLDGDMLASKVDEPFRSLLRGMLARNPESRFTMIEVGRELGSLSELST